MRIGIHGLRRGSWHRVLDNSQIHYVVIQVGTSRVPVPRSSVQLRRGRPLVWTVVRDEPRDLGIEVVYGVCPNCIARARLDEGESTFSCPRCGFAFPVEWPAAVARTERCALAGSGAA